MESSRNGSASWFSESPEAQSHVRPQKSFLWPLLLLILTILTTLTAGYLFHLSFAVGSSESFRSVPGLLDSPWLLLNGFPYCFTLLAILLAHEMGHYLTCRYYGIDATLPYVIPAPMLFGTFGAVIRIRSPFRTRRELFDVAVAGPLAGFALIIPALIMGVALSNQLSPRAFDGPTFEFGEPLLFRLAVGWFFESENELLLNLHPIGWAAWFGVLATSMNLLPAGQLDGGHLVYALFGKRVHRLVSFLTLGSLLILGIFFWPGYIVFGVVLLFMGIRHPRPLNSDREELGTARRWVALLSLLVFVLTFIPTPVKIF